MLFDFIKGRLIIVRLLLLAACGGLVAIGIASLYAVGYPADVPGGLPDLADKWEKQAQYAAIGLACFLVINMVNYRRLGAMSYWLYAIILALLAVLLVSKYIVRLSFAPVRNGTYQWIVIEIAGKQLPSLQPSELCKLIYILALSWYLRYRSNYRRFKALLGPFALTLLPMGLILLEPDLGTVMLMMPILFTMLFVAGAKVKHLALILLMAALVSPVMWLKMEPYQRARVSSVLFQSETIRDEAQKHPRLTELILGKTFDEGKWQRDDGYQLIRSKYAIASGGLEGYGFRQGPFIKYNFLPERHNDFIFAAIAHQWGFRGCAAVLALYAVIVFCGIEIASNNKDPFGRLVAVGISTLFAAEVFITVSMTIGLMPVTGLTLPLVSYGGSSLLVHLAAIGLLNNVGRCQPFGVARENMDLE